MNNIEICLTVNTNKRATTSLRGWGGGGGGGGGEKGGGGIKRTETDGDRGRETERWGGGGERYHSGFHTRRKN